MLVGRRECDTKICTWQKLLTIVGMNIILFRHKKYTFAFTKFASFNSGGNSAYPLSTESTGCQLANGLSTGQETLTYLSKSTMISWFFIINTGTCA